MERGSLNLLEVRLALKETEGRFQKGREVEATSAGDEGAAEAATAIVAEAEAEEEV
eukprot:m.28934 g.28934  ORF g.28934 m.28934 type:complete len:56 (+) comp31107_c0_seq2:68-235(+)